MILVSEDYLKMNEVDINGQPAGDPNDEPADYTAPEPVNVAGVDDQQVPENPEPRDSNSPEDGTEGDTTDYTAEGDVPPEDGTEGDTTDYTAEGDVPPEDGGEYPQDGGGGEVPATGGDNQVTADDARGMEEEIFKDLTPDQVDLKHKELKNNFMELYDSTSTIVDRVNQIPSDERFTQTISFVSKQLSDLRTMVSDYMNNVYSTKSYMENAMNYNRFLVTLNGINDILEEINKELTNNS